MAYPEDNESGPCPSSHPVRLVTLFYEVRDQLKTMRPELHLPSPQMMWDVDAWSGLRSQAYDPVQPFVTAQGE